MFTLNTVIKAYLIAAESETTGYDIAKAVMHRCGNTHQQIYRELSRMFINGEVTRRTVPQVGKPDRVYYTPTDKLVMEDLEHKGSDFRKTVVAYEILTNDFLNNTNHYYGYISALREAEKAYVESIS